MKKLFIILCLFYGTAQAQTLFPNLAPNVSSSTNYLKYGYLEAGTFIFTPRDTFPALLPSLIKHANGHYYQSDGNGAPWTEFQSGGGGGSFSFNGRTGAVSPLNADYSLYYASIIHSHTYASLTSKPTSVSASGILDAATTTSVALRKLNGDSAHNKGDNYVRQDRLMNFFDSLYNAHQVNIGNALGTGDSLFAINADTIKAKTLSITGPDVSRSVSATTISFVIGSIKTGLALISGNGSSTAYDISLSSTPSWIGYPAPANAASIGITYIEPITNGIRVHWATAPASGSNNISLYYSYK